MLFGTTDAVCFTMNPEAVLMSQYFLLGQLTGLAILNVNRCPEWLYPVIVSQMFNIDHLEIWIWIMNHLK